MSDKQYTSVGFGIGMMVFMLMSSLNAEDPITTLGHIAIMATGLLSGVLWYILYDKVMRRNK